MSYEYEIRVPVTGFNIYRAKAATEDEAQAAYEDGNADFIDTKIESEGDPQFIPIVPAEFQPKEDCACDGCEDTRKAA